ncbi:MAG: pyridoxamine 5-phosphate oxidase-related, binding [Dactylosporangium sp.]|jgi:predicted pyridoxine 5'-phosphate oxidase superfamily flavin-nucleotide-binding protein|nr:pyridoxamine 5-phosphate oxidase-related, binding [Dactylosporangium sp.]
MRHVRPEIVLYSDRRSVVDHPNTWPGSAGEHQLQERFGTAERAERFYSQQVLDHLNEQMREFVADQEMMFVATSDAHGECDNTFRAGPAGFVRVLDDERLSWPEYRGNGVMASLGNITENPHVGLLFMDFTRQLIGLHVNGRAEIVEDAAMRAEYDEVEVDDIPGRRPERWVVVEVEEAYIHCAKHIPRLVKTPRERAWGTDDVRRKGGDFFSASKEPRPWVPEAPARALSAGRPHGSQVAQAARMAEATEAARVAEADRIAEAADAPSVDVPTADSPATDALATDAPAVDAPAANAPAADGANEVRRSPGRHRRRLRLLNPAPRPGEGG